MPPRDAADASQGPRARDPRPLKRGGKDPRVIFAAAYFVLAFVALIHPVFTYVGNRVEPRVFGLPFSLVYVLAWIAANTVVLAWMYRSRVIDATQDEADEGIVAGLEATRRV